MPRTKFVNNEDEEEIVPKKKVKTFDATDGIKCRSVIQGGLYMDGQKTGMTYSWMDYGDVSDVEYRDLVAEVRSKSRFVFNPWFIIDDEDFLNEFPNVRDFYEKSYTSKDLREILNLSVNQMITEIEKLPKVAKESLKSIAAKMVANGTLDSISKIKALDKIYGTDLNLISTFFNEDDE